ncbi:gliding motility-associated C-terminal domain-containing protein [Chitinophagaceae bacterium LWZ2-11]
MKHLISTIALVFMIVLLTTKTRAQTYVFAQLSGTPINTAGWSLQGGAKVGNVIQSGNSEIIVCPISSFGSGSIFYNQPLNLSVCSKWTAEFDFRIYDGSQADGLAFCFLDVPPVGFVTGGGLGIPATANGLKVCFDPNPNCYPYSYANMPKIEIRWGAGYDECWTQPTADNSQGTLGFVRSPTYNHAKITYNSGTINVYVNNTLYVSGFQQFNFSGYLGFTASTGGKTDNHSIKNVIIYTDMPPSVAGTAATTCSSGAIQLGTATNAGYSYAWSPSTGLSSTTISNPVATLTNSSNSVVSQKYYVKTSFVNNPGCASVDSVTITVNPQPSVSIGASQTAACTGTAVTFTATPVNGGTTPVYQWKLNGNNVGTNSATYTNNTLNTSDVINCVMTSSTICNTPVTSNNVSVTINSPVSSVNINTTATNICSGSNVTYTAAPVNGGTAPVYQWKLNGNNVGTNSATYANNNLANGDVVSCVLTSSVPCTSPVTSNSISMSVTATVTPSITITASTAATICSGTSVTYTATAVNGGAGPVYQWKKNGNNVGSNNVSYTDNALLTGDIISCVLTSNATCVVSTTAASNTIKMTVNTAAVPSVSITSSATSICAGTNVTFTAAAVNGGAAPGYQWKLNGNNVGTNSASYANAGLSNNDIISCVLTSSVACTAPATSNSINMGVSPGATPSISVATAQTSICSGTPVTFNATAVAGGTSPAYQWKKNGANVGSNTASYIDNTLVNGDVITCTLTSNIACAVNPVAVSTGIQMTVNALPSITIAASQTTVCSGTAITFTATPSNGGNTPVYQWKLNGNNVGTNNPLYTNNTLTTGDVISCSMTGSTGCTTVAASNNIAVTVTSAVSSVSITSSATSICAGTNVTFTAAAVNGGASPAYQWKLNGNNVGANSSTYATNNIADGDIISCTLTSSVACTAPVTSTGITMAVGTPATPTITISMPTVSTLCSGTAVTFTAVATNTGSTAIYQWKLNGNNVGANNPVYTNNTLITGDVISCVLTSSAACITASQVASNNIKVTVVPVLTPSVVLAASSTSACSGQTVTFTATGTNAGQSPVYEWSVNGSVAATGSTIYSSDHLKTGDVVTCKLTSNSACTTSSTVVSSGITITIYPAPSITAGSDKTIQEGKGVLLDATVSGNINGYLWTPPLGLDNNTILNPTASPLATTTYRLTVTTADGCSASDSLTVKVLKLLNVPNIFSPNGDGINDTWEIPYLKDYAGCVVEIYNRYGQQIYRTIGYDKPWNGYVNGNPLPVGTYYYIINPKNNMPVISGSVTIVK